MDALADPAISKVVVEKAAQVGATEATLNMIGFYMGHDPAPLLVIQPTIEMAEGWSKDRLSTMLRDTPALRDKVREARSRDSGNTLRQKVFPGGRLNIIGANAPAGLASRPIRIVIADEVDRYPASAGTEGDPLALAAKRQTTFWNRKTFVASTPTLVATSVIDREFRNSDRRRYFVPCHDCGTPQVLKWENVRWDKDKAGEHMPQTAHYVCEHCGSIWTDADRWGAVEKGEWRAEASSKGVAGFHIPGFLSPWLTLEEIVRDFLKAKDDPSLLQVWVNTVLGEPWEEKGEGVDGGGLIGRGEAYDGETLPDNVLVVTAGVDVQDNRLEAQFIAWGAKEESWPFRYEILDGDPAQDTVWQELDELLLETFSTESGRKLRVRAACIDTGGHHADRVYSFTKRRRARRIFATKGVANRGASRPIWPKRSSKAKGNNEVFVVGVDTAKDAIYGRLRIGKPGPGYVHFPQAEGFDKAYFDQLTSEQVVTRKREGRPYRVWILPEKRRNEGLDTFVLALAALKSLPIRLDTATAPAAQAKAAENIPDDDPEPPPPPPAGSAPATEKPARGVRRSGWIGRRRGFLRG